VKNVSYEIIVQGEVDSNVIGIYSLNYVAETEDDKILFVKRTVKVVDTVSPRLEILGDYSEKITVGETYLDPGVVVIDADANVLVTKNDDIDIGKPGVYSITYRASDSSGNLSAPLVRTIVVEDLSPPNIILNGDSVVWVNIGESYVDQSANAVDLVDGVVPVQMFGFVDVTTVGTYSISYLARDKSGNTSPIVSRTVVVKDNIPPTIEIIGPDVVRIRHGDDWQDPGAIANDNVDGPLSVVRSGEVDSGRVGSYIISYNAVDSQRNYSESVSRIVIV
jgi:hypothetical protein